MVNAPGSEVNRGSGPVLGGNWTSIVPPVRGNALAGGGLGDRAGGRIGTEGAGCFGSPGAPSEGGLASDESGTTGFAGGAGDGEDCPPAAAPPEEGAGGG